MKKRMEFFLPEPDTECVCVCLFVCFWRI